MVICTQLHIKTKQWIIESTDIHAGNYTYVQQYKQIHTTLHRGGTVLSVVVARGMVFTLAKVKDFVLVHTCLSDDFP
jgi:hypothetical protein